MPLGGMVALGVGSLVANMFSAKNAKKAAQTAAQQQVASGDKALGVAKDVYGEQKAALQPYQQAGQYALNNLMARQYGGNGQPGTQSMNAGAVGLRNAPGWGPNGFSLANLRQPMGGNPAMQPGMPQPQGGMPPPGQGPMQQPGGGGMPERGPELPPQPGAPPPPGPPQPGQPPQPGGQEQMVTVQAPTGATMRLPMSLAKQAEAKGATILG